MEKKKAVKFEFEFEFESCNKRTLETDNKTDDETRDKVIAYVAVRTYVH